MSPYIRSEPSQEEHGRHACYNCVAKSSHGFLLINRADSRRIGLRTGQPLDERRDRDTRKQEGGALWRGDPGDRPSGSRISQGEDNLRLYPLFQAVTQVGQSALVFALLSLSLQFASLPLQFPLLFFDLSLLLSLDSFLPLQLISG